MSDVGTMRPPAVGLGHARLRALLASDVSATATLVVLVFVLAAATWGTWGDLSSDTGYDIEAGRRIADGLLPYSDFTYYYGPLAPFLVGLASWIGSPGVGSGVALGLPVALAIIFATYAVARLFVSPAGAFLASAITSGVAFIPNNYGYVLPHTMAATLGTLLLLALVLCVARYLATGNSAWLLTGGVCVGLTALTKPEPTLAALLGVGVWLLCRRRAGLARPREFLLVAAPALVLPAAIYGALSTTTSLHRLVLENLYPVDFLNAAGNTLVKARIPLTLESFAVLGGKLTLYACGVLALVLAAKGLQHPRLRSPLLAGCAAFGLLVLLVAVLKPDGLRDGFYYFYGWIPAGALIAVAIGLRRMRRATRVWESGQQLGLLVDTVLLVLAATTYGAFVIHGWRPQMAVYYIPFGALLLVRLHLVELARNRAAYALGFAWIVFLAAAGTGLTLKDARAESFTVRGPKGSLAASPAEGKLYQSAVDLIDRRTRPGERILLAPLLTGLNALSGRPSPIRELSMLPGALAGDDRETAAIHALEDAGVRLAIIDQREWKGYGHGSFGSSFDRQIAHWLERNFTRTTTLRVSGAEPHELQVWWRQSR